MAPSESKKSTFDLERRVAKRLSDLRTELQFERGVPASEASGVAIVSALIMNADADQLTRLLKENR